PVCWQQVNKALTGTTVNSSSNASVFAQSVTFTATVAVLSPGAGPLTGSVTFKDGSGTLGTGQLSSRDGVTTESCGTTTAGVGRASTSTTLRSHLHASMHGQGVTLPATVRPVSPGAGTPGGAVTFYDGGTVLGTVTLGSSGVVSFSTTSLSVGTHSLTAVYSG